MQIKCPACSAGFSLDAAIGLDAGRAALAAALKMPAPLAQLWSQYLALFRSGGRVLSFDRAERLMTELIPSLNALTVTRNGSVRPCPLSVWQQGLDRMVELRNADKLNLPLKSHGYLVEIVFALADQAAATQERTTETARKSGEHRKSGDDNYERKLKLATVRGDFALSLINRDEAIQRLADIGYPPEALNE